MVGTCAAVMITSASAGQVAPSFTLVEPQAGVNSAFLTVTDDGAYVIGLSGGGTSMEWTREGGAVFSTVFASAVSQISGDGRYVATGGPARRGRNDVYEPLGMLPGWDFGIARNINGDGSVIVGAYEASGTSNSDGEAFIWTESGGLRGLGWASPGHTGFSQANAVSHDGSTVVGYSIGIQTSGAFVWTEAGGMRLLTQPPLADTTSSASYVSSNNRFVGGWCNDPSPLVTRGPAIWDLQTGALRHLGAVPGRVGGTATWVSEDGTTAYGEMSNGAGGLDPTAFFWNETTGMMYFSDYLTQLGVMMPEGIDSIRIRDMTPDGTTIIGSAVRDGFQYSFIATVPGPMSAMPLVGLIVVCRRLRFARD